MQTISDKEGGNGQRDLKPTLMLPSDQSGIAPGQHLVQVTAAVEVPVTSTVVPGL